MDSNLDSKCLESLNDLQHLNGLDAQPRDSLRTPHLLDSKYRESHHLVSLNPSESQTRGSLDSLTQHNFHTLSHCAYIGKGNKAYSFLNTLQADILVLTTPGLDVLHIKRQAGVKHYCHIVHSLSPMTYRVFGVDYFHSVLVANAVQRDFVRQIESAHNLKPKHIAITGSTYLDELYKIYLQMLNTQAEHNQYSQDLKHSNTAQQTQDLKHSKLTQDSHLSQNPNLDSQYSQDLASHPSPRILVSPSWGKESLLSKYALKLLLPLAQSGFSLLIRPHPQSSISPSEASNLAYLKDALKAYKNVSWDSNVSNVPAFMYSDLMISDFSSVIFDYVCLQGKPVITIEDEMDLSGYDMADIPRDQIWTFKALKSIGKRIHPSEFENLKEIILQICKEYGGSQAKSKEKLDSGLDAEADSTLESQNLESISSCVDSTSESKFKSETGLDSQTQTSHKQNLVSPVAVSQNLDSCSQSVSESCATSDSQSQNNSESASDSHSSHNDLNSLAHNLSSIQKLLWQYPHNAGLQSTLELLKIERELLQNALKPQARLVARYTELEGMIQSAQAKWSDLDAQSNPNSESALDSQAQTSHKQNLVSQPDLDSNSESPFHSKSPPEHQTPGTHSSIDQSTHCISNH